MKIVITAKGETLQSQVDPRFGRASFFILYDLDNDSHQVIEKDTSALHGVGIQTAETIVRSGAKAVITGNCGPNAYRVLQAGGVEIYIGFSGTVFEAINAYKKGELKKAETSNVGGHW